MALAVGAVRLDRPELAARIGDALRARSVLLVAEAGFGKTAALEEALKRNNMTAGWVHCADAAGDAGRLLGLVLDAMRSALPGAADVLDDRLRSARDPVDPQLAAGALERELERLLIDPLVIVLDDAEALAESPAALAL